MFIIAGMGIYQIFHNRHQEFTPNAHILYLSFAVLIVFGFVGTLFPSVAFWIIMIILHLAWVVFMSFQFYYNGIIKCRIRANRKCCNWDVAWKLLHKNYTQFPSHPHSTEKLAYVIILNFVNLLLYVCLCVHVYVCVYVCVCVCVCVCMCVRERECEHMYMSMYACMYVYMYVIFVYTYVSR